MQRGAAFFLFKPYCLRDAPLQPYESIDTKGLLSPLAFFVWIRFAFYKTSQFDKKNVKPHKSTREKASWVHVTFSTLGHKCVKSKGISISLSLWGTQQSESSLLFASDYFPSDPLFSALLQRSQERRRWIQERQKRKQMKLLLTTLFIFIFFFGFFFYIALYVVFLCRLVVVPWVFGNIMRWLTTTRKNKRTMVVE